MNGTKFYLKDENEFVFYDGANLVFELGKGNVLSMHTDLYIANAEFELIEEQTIDIESIAEFEVTGCNIKFKDTLIPTESIVNDMMIRKINELVQAVKHLNKEIQSIKKKE